MHFVPFDWFSIEMDKAILNTRIKQICMVQLTDRDRDILHVEGRIFLYDSDAIICIDIYSAYYFFFCSQISTDDCMHCFFFGGWKCNYAK